MLWMRKSKKNQNGSPQASGAMSIEPEDVVEGLLDAKDCLRAWPLFGPVRETRGYLKANCDREIDDGPNAEKAPEVDDGPTAEQEHKALCEKNAMRVAHYLRDDVPRVLNDIADRLDACAYGAPQSSDDDRQRNLGDDEQDDAGPDDHDRDFSETDFVRRMTQAGNMEVPASFLRGLGELIQNSRRRAGSSGQGLTEIGVDAAAFRQAAGRNVPAHERQLDRDDGKALRRKEGSGDSARHGHDGLESRHHLQGALPSKSKKGAS